MLVGTLKCSITNRRKRNINAIAETVTRLKSTEVEKKREKHKNSAWITFHTAFPFMQNRPIINRRKTKINTIAKTVTRVKSLTGRSFQDRKNNGKQK